MSAQVQKWLDHIRTLAADIGPRGPTTEGERLGAQYRANTLRQLGLDPQVEGFTSARSIFQPHLLTAAALLLAFAIYPWAGRASCRGRGAHLAGRARLRRPSSASAITRSAGSSPSSPARTWSPPSRPRPSTARIWC